MVLFNIFGKKDASENNSGESHASELAELRAKLARAEQERDELAREKNSLAQKAESLAQENQTLTQEKHALTQPYPDKHLQPILAPSAKQECA